MTMSQEVLTNDLDLLSIDNSKGHAMDRTFLYPLRFEPIYQYRLWGGRHLADFLTAPLPSGPIGEAWLLSDRNDHQSRVADGPLKGQTIGQLLEPFPRQLLGKLAGRFRRFPLLLKFLDAHEMLSVPRKQIGICCHRAIRQRPKHGSCWKPRHKAASMLA